MSKVYFSKEITGEKVLELYKMLGKELPGNVAVKVHSGEKGNQNFLRPDFWKDIIDYVSGTVVECNTAYEGERNTSEKHLKLLKTTAGVIISRLTFLMRKVPTRSFLSPKARL